MRQVGGKSNSDSAQQDRAFPGCVVETQPVKQDDLVSIDVESDNTAVVFTTAVFLSTRNLRDECPEPKPFQ